MLDFSFQSGAGTIVIVVITTALLKVGHDFLKVKVFDEIKEVIMKPHDLNFYHLTDDEKLELPILTLDPMIRTENLFNSLKIVTVGDLCNLSERELREIKGLGRITLKEIKSKLDKIGLSLRDC